MKRQAVSGPELYEELDRLPEKFRAPIVLCHLEGLTNEQAAVQLGLPVRTVQRRLAQGRERLRAAAGRQGIDPAIGLLGAGVRRRLRSRKRGWRRRYGPPRDWLRARDGCAWPRRP